MRVALLQLAADIDSAANRDLVTSQLAELDVDDGIDLVVLPEATMHDFGAPDLDLAPIAEPLDGPFVQMIAAEAVRLRTTIVAGMFERTDGLPFNTLVVVGPDGQLRATYRKIHLYDSFGYKESERLLPGEIAPVVVEIAGRPVGLMTCYDLRFPELARALVDAGAETIVVPAAWVAGEHKLDHWRTLLTARAIENTVHVVAAGQGGDRYTGHSLVVDPWGSIVDEAASEPAIVQAVLDADDVAKARSVNPSLANRRIKPTS
ncbi:carbon-nitrogen hydrolase family protein [Aeromicrobium wangtongii]|uniref:Carbon-nitrogen hydrolase family protein n=1 Tax=Aeromicrobium wangtongii TaxID=2969247 RepID=A0ABY5M6N6_9ACTN|nr:carbon-nitrogen hydrolase family protein [Aeromicrobium wangtongii]MCD9199470.1 carbon-nitrogen hydrolase family protein [Aeromicrobium wangtongii]UUP13823.1 carbon-nitrogen hydrolase family protein [Aeromicrobium wangtongii]